MNRNSTDAVLVEKNIRSNVKLTAATDMPISQQLTSQRKSPEVIQARGMASYECLDFWWKVEHGCGQIKFEKSRAISSVDHLFLGEL
jgi:hypothetical protein